MKEEPSKNEGSPIKVKVYAKRVSSQNGRLTEKQEYSYYKVLFKESINRP
jgi:hypothetical protein